MRTRHALFTLALLTSGVVIGAASQQFASADVDDGDRPVLINIEPCRLADTRPAPATVGPRASKIGTADTHTIDVRDADTDCAGTIPPDAQALALNVTALGATAQTFLTIWAGGDRPNASSLNPAPGAPPTPNAVTVDLSVDQTFNIYNDVGAVHVVVDVGGYYVNHNHDDRYHPNGVVGSASLGVEWISVRSSASTREASVAFKGATILRPAGSPVGHYCIHLPDPITVPREAAVGSIQRTGDAIGTMLVTVNHGNACNLTGNWFFAVETFDADDEPADFPFMLLVPRG